MTDSELQALKNTFIDRTKKHIHLVNQAAQKIGKSFPNHDASKLNMLLDGYCFFCKPDEERTDEENALLDAVTYTHIKNCPHHPEYWTDTPLSGFTRKNFTPHGIIDCSQMPMEALDELVCDWWAVGTEKGNTVAEWFDKVNGSRWYFTPEQQKYIRELIIKVEN